MKRAGSIRTVFVCAVLTCLSALLLSCGGGGDSGSAPGASGSIELKAEPTSIWADGQSSSTITATIKDSAGKPARYGTEVTFTTTLGSFRNGSTTYTVYALGRDAAGEPTGVVSVSLIAGTTSGTATVTARSNNVSQSVYVVIGAGEPGSITLTTGSSSIPADGISSTSVTALVKDSTGKAVPKGTIVSFYTTLGTFAGTTGAAQIDLTTEDDSGTGTVYLIAGRTAGTANVSVKSYGMTQKTTVQFTNSGPGTITLSASAQTLPADGVSSLSITATIKDSAGAAAVKGTSVTFKTTLGSFSNNEKTYTVTTPDDTGVIIISLIAGTTPGTATVTAESSSVTQSVSISFTHAGNTGVPVAEEFSLAAAYVNVSGLWMASLEDKITATVGDIYGNAVKDDTIIYFKTYNTGGILEKDQDPTSKGFASNNLYTTGERTPLQGYAFVTAETSGAATTRVTSIAVTPYPDEHIIYAGTNGGGVYKSTDTGASWETVSRSTENQKQGQNLIDPYIKGHRAIAVDPDDHNTIYVGTGYLGKGNVYRSLDGGMNWNSNNVEEWNGLYETTAAVLTVVCDGDDVSTTDYPYVWIGTEGRGPLYATDGKTFQPSNGIASTPVAGSGNVGNGTMSQPVLSYTSKTETWTATCTVSTGTATTPAFTGTGDGSMSAVTTSSTTKTENWTVQYKTTAGTVTPGSGNTGNGSVVDINVTKPNAASETWTLTCNSVSVVIGTVTGSATANGTVTGISVTGGPTETFTLTCLTAGTNGTFSVVSNKRGSFGTATAGTTFTSSDSKVSLLISTGSGTGYTAGQIFTFTSTNTTTFSVQSSVVGYYLDATVGEKYKESDAISFQINQGSTAFVAGDTLTFTTTTVWQVVGSVSGAQTNTATTGTAYTSDNNEVGFTITEGATAFVDGDKFTFSTTAGATYWTVAGTVSGTQTNKAYDGELYYSDGKEVSFTITAGTIAFGNGDTFTFTVTASGLGHGWTVWDIVRVPSTHGSSAVLYAGTATGVYKSTNGGQTWSSLTSFTGDYVIALALFSTATGGSSDIIYAGTQNAGVWVSTNSGSTWTQYTTGMDSGNSATIKDILVDPSNYKLYAITYKGPVDAATGKVYVHPLNSDGTMTSAGWSEAGTGLSGEALYALAAAKPSDPTALFVGGEGISLYKATSGLGTGSPSWGESKTGLSNTIMARMAVLFSGECTMSIEETALGNSQYAYKIYIEDVNGNPPITGSTFTAVTYDSSNTVIDTIINKTYGDSLTNTGTFRDPANPTTNNPYEKTVDFSGTVAKVVFTFTPKCETTAPGCSGGIQTATYSH